MIKDTTTKDGSAAITSDHWHVVRAHHSGDEKTTHPFLRTIVSEHEDRVASSNAAKALVKKLVKEMGADDEIDQTSMDAFFIRPPHFKSLKWARRRKG